MVRDFVLNPETNKPAFVITTHQDIEREELTAQLDAAVAEQEAVIEAKRAEFEAALVSDPEVSNATQAVEDKKSELEKYDATAATASVDAGTEGSGSEDTESVEEEATAEFPQTA